MLSTNTIGTCLAEILVSIQRSCNYLESRYPEPEGFNLALFELCVEPLDTGQITKEEAIEGLKFLLNYTSSIK